MDNNKPNTISNIPTNNRYGILADCHILDDQEPQKNTETPNKQHTATNDTTTKLLPIYIHGKNNHVKLLEKLKANYPNAYHTKYTSGKLKIMFQKIAHFKDFKELCRVNDIQYHTYSVSNEKVLTVVLKGPLPRKNYYQRPQVTGTQPPKAALSYQLPPNTRYIGLHLPLAPP